MKRPGSRAPALGGHRLGSTRWPGARVALPHKTCQTELAAWHCGPGGGRRRGGGRVGRWDPRG